MKIICNFFNENLEISKIVYKFAKILRNNKYEDTW